MFLQLHDSAAMGNKFSNVPDLNLPEDFKVSNRQILTTFLDEASQIATQELDKALKKAQQKKDLQSMLDELPTLDLDLLEFDEIPEFDPSTLADRQMKGFWATLFKIGAWLLKYGKIVFDYAKKAAKTVNLVQMNNRIDGYYQSNKYDFQNLNSLNKAQIKNQLRFLNGDYLNAVNSKNEVDTAALGRVIMGYQNRLNSLPMFSTNQMLIGGGVLLAILLLRK